MNGPNRNRSHHVSHDFVSLLEDVLGIKVHVIDETTDFNKLGSPTPAQGPSMPMFVNSDGDTVLLIDDAFHEDTEVAYVMYVRCKTGQKYVAQGSEFFDGRWRPISGIAQQVYDGFRDYYGMKHSNYYGSDDHAAGQGMPGTRVPEDEPDEPTNNPTDRY